MTSPQQTGRKSHRAGNRRCVVNAVSTEHARLQTLMALAATQEDGKSGHGRRRTLVARRSSSLFLLTVNSREDDLEDARNLSFLFPFNPTGWYDSEFEALLAEAGSTYNPERRRDLLWQAQAIAYEEAPWIFLWRWYDFYGISNDVDWSPRPDGLIYIHQARSSG